MALPLSNTPLLTGDDLLYCFGIGSVTVWLAIRTCGGRWLPRASTPMVVRRYLLVCGSGALAAQSLHVGLLEPHDVMYSCLVGLLTAAAVLAVSRPDAATLGLRAAPVFVTLYVVLLLGCGWLWPQAVGYFNPAAQPFASLFGLPPFEVVFPFCFGLVWPAIVAWCLDVQPLRIAIFSEERRPPRGALSSGFSSWPPTGWRSLFRGR